MGASPRMRQGGLPTPPAGRRHFQSSRYAPLSWSGSIRLIEAPVMAVGQLARIEHEGRDEVVADIERRVMQERRREHHAHEAAEEEEPPLGLPDTAVYRCQEAFFAGPRHYRPVERETCHAHYSQLPSEKMGLARERELCAVTKAEYRVQGPVAQKIGELLREKEHHLVEYYLVRRRARCREVQKPAEHVEERLIVVRERKQDGD